MAVAVPEFQSLLARLVLELGADILRLLTNTDRLDQRELLTYISAAYPELVSPYLQASGELTAQWYAEQPVAAPTLFVPQLADLPPVEQLAAQARWSVLQAKPVETLQGKAGQMVFDESRRTVIDNTTRERVRWARHASANACGFCRMLATRGAVYRSESLAKKSHPNCHCLAVPNRDGRYEPPPYVEKWRQEYKDARAAGLVTPGSIANAMDGHRDRRDNRANLAQRAKNSASPSTQGGGGGGKPPTKPPTRSGAAQPSGPDPKWFRSSRAHVNGLVGAYRQAIVDYTGKPHERINGWLRRSGAKPDPWVSSRVRSLDAVLAKNPLERPTVLTRVVSLRGTFNLTSGEGLAGIVGSPRVEDGYLSTSRKRTFTMKEIKDPVVLDVIAPPGTPAAAIEDVSQYPGQFEVLLGRGLSYVLADPKWDERNGVWRARMMILGKESGR
ncbi:VG15 protein [Tsukamurella tyrosinosolvens]|uniref:VG15 protein n=1 Tax=Tsukamurella tyrosinosolvens TaxID=57704 RepID=UPI002DD421E2|nr:ADP-ribosyltransferase [Tsukamurella tyrosinosolvens]MEC4616202.1 ADP-ribosyltransferase [Tsukamurella tyrosinosolvens]